jgi:hypothetical protein
MSAWIGVMFAPAKEQESYVVKVSVEVTKSRTSHHPYHRALWQTSPEE